jgi:hypothetical protein
VRPQQEMKQRGTAIQMQTPRFYWITSSQKKNHFIYETGNTNHSFISASRITCMLTPPPPVSLQPGFCIQKYKLIKRVYEWTFKKCTEEDKLFFSLDDRQCLRKWP